MFQRLALAKLNDAVELYRKAHRAAQQHRAGTGFESASRHFRYIVENFLPQHYESWAADLKEMQDLLGDVHDLDVLRSDIRRHSARAGPAGARRMGRENRRPREDRASRSFWLKPAARNLFGSTGDPGCREDNTLRPVQLDERRARLFGQLTQHLRSHKPEQLPPALRCAVFEASNSRLLQ